MWLVEVIRHVWFSCRLFQRAKVTISAPSVATRRAQAWDMGQCRRGYREGVQEHGSIWTLACRPFL